MKTIHNSTDYWNQPCTCPLPNGCGWHCDGLTWCKVARLMLPRAIYLEWLDRPDVQERLIDQGVSLEHARED